MINFDIIEQWLVDCHVTIIEYMSLIPNNFKLYIYIQNNIMIDQIIKYIDEHAVIFGLMALILLFIVFKLYNKCCWQSALI